MESTKICTCCKTEKNLTEFYKRKSIKDGHSTICKKCKSEKDKKYREENKTKIYQSKKEYREKNIDTIRVKKKEYRNNNKEKISKRDKEYRDRNIEEIKKNKKIYYEANKEHVLLKNKEYQKKNRLRINKYLLEYFKTEIGSASKLNTRHKRRAIIKDGDATTQQLKELYSTVKNCYWCNTKLNKKNTHLDHFIPLSKGGLHTIDNLVLSCSCCNLKKSNKDPYQFALEKGRLL